jgi:2-hydroxychromene-2-carboxylate isomerase
MRCYLGVMRTLHFYFDYISPYAYLATRRLAPVFEGCDVEIVPVPVLFAGLLSHWGNTGPAEIAPKRVLMFKDVIRKAGRWDIPFALPAFHPFNPLLALRVTVAAPDPTAQRALMDALFESAWCRGEHLSDESVVHGAITRAGLDAEPLLRAAQSDGVKDLLRAHTRAAIRRGVFGVPSFAVADELFWGSDVLEDVRDHLQGRDLVPADFFRTLSMLKSSAERKRPPV